MTPPFGHDELVLRFAHLLRDALQDLAAPHEAYADIFLRHAVVVGAPAVGHPFEILPPRDVDRVVADAVARPDPGAVFPSRILVAHPHGVGDAVCDAGVEVLLLIAPCRGLPHRVFWSSSQAWRGEVRIELPSGPTQLTSSPP